MNKATLGFAMLAIGVVVGLTLPPPLAQSEAPKVQTWEQYCQKVEHEDVNPTLKAAGEKGYELVGAFYSTGRLLCFRRPVP